MLRAGVARSTVTPPVGMTMAGYAAREGVALDKDTDLLATALVLDDGTTRIAIIAIDLVFLQEPFVTALREEIGQRIGVPRSNILLNFSHTHCGPTSEGLQYDDDEHHHQLRQAYSSRLRAEIPALTEMAVHRLAPARIGTGTGEARIGINRREIQEDGSPILGENPSGPVDHEVRVLRLDDLTGKPIAVVFAHGCHTVTMGPKCLKWSSDYVGPARDLIEQHTGALSLFLQANAGEINPIVGIGPDQDNSYQKNRVGMILATETLKVHASIYTESVRGAVSRVGSLAKIPYYPRIPLDHEPDTQIVAREEMLEFPLLKFPDAATADAIYSKWDSEVSSLVETKLSGGPLNVARHFRHWAKALRNAVATGAKPAIHIPVQTLRLGSFAIAAVPGETFSTQGMDVKKKSPFPHTLFLGYSNGCASYIPTADAYPRGGWLITERYYIPDLIFQAYLLPTALAPECSDLMVNKSLEMLRGLR